MSYGDLPVAEIDANPGQPRRHFDEAALDELAASIRESGLLQPVVVRPFAGRYQLVAGERRWRACQRSGLTVIPTRIIEGLSDEQAYVMSVAENVSRRDMTLTEEAHAFAELQSFGRTAKEIGAMFGKTADYVTWRMGLLGLTDELAGLVDQGAMTPTAGYFAAKLSPVGQQVFASRYVRGEFRTEGDAKAAARAYLLAEQQTEFWADQDFEPERRRARSQAVTLKMLDERKRLREATAMLTRITESDVAELALAPDAIASLRAGTDELIAAARAALIRLQTAGAVAELEVAS